LADDKKDGSDLGVLALWLLFSVLFVEFDCKGCKD